MSTYTVKTFQSGDGEAIRLPKGVSFGAGVELTLVTTDDHITLTPTRRSMEEMLDRLSRLPVPSSIEVRDTEDIPERPGL